MEFSGIFYWSSTTFDCITGANYAGTFCGCATYWKNASLDFVAGFIANGIDSDGAGDSGKWNQQRA